MSEDQGSSSQNQSHTDPAVDSTIQEIEDAFSEWDKKTIGAQGINYRFSYLAVLLGPIAVLLLTSQILVFPGGGAAGIVLIAGELALLLVAVIIGVCHIGHRSSKWIEFRMRAEMLRREQFLALARVGPYREQTNLAEMVGRRLVKLKSEPIEDLVHLRYEDGTPWRDALEDEGAESALPPDSCCLDRILNERIRDQKEWFSRKSTHFGKLDNQWESIAKSALILALVVAAMHVVLLTTGDGHANGDRPFFQMFIEIAAIVLPAVGISASGMQSIFEGRRLNRSYHYHSKALTRLEGELTKILHRRERESDSRQLRVLDFKLKRLVLRLEKLLTDELLYWWMIKESPLWSRLTR